MFADGLWNVWYITAPYSFPGCKVFFCSIDHRAIRSATVAIRAPERPSGDQGSKTTLKQSGLSNKFDTAWHSLKQWHNQTAYPVPKKRLRSEQLFARWHMTQQKHIVVVYMLLRAMCLRLGQGCALAQPHFRGVYAPHTPTGGQGSYQPPQRTNLVKDLRQEHIILHPSEHCTGDKAPACLGSCCCVPPGWLANGIQREIRLIPWLSGLRCPGEHQNHPMKQDRQGHDSHTQQRGAY